MNADPDPDPQPQNSLPTTAERSAEFFHKPDSAFVILVVVLIAMPFIMFEALFVPIALAPTAFALGAGYGFGINRFAIDAIFAFFWVGVFGSGFSAIMIWSAYTIDRFRRIRDRRPSPVGKAPAKPFQPGALRQRCWGFLLKVVGVGLLSLLISFIAGIYAGKTVERELAEAIAEADASDPNWRFADLTANREVPPVEEDSAVVVAEAVDRLPNGVWPFNPKLKPGTPNPPSTRVETAVATLHKIASNVQLDADSAEALREDLSLYRDAIAIALKASEYRRGYHLLDYPNDLYATLLPETQNARYVASLLEAHAAIQAQDGKIDDALDTCRSIMGIGRSIGDEPTLISILARISIENIAMSAAKRALGQGEASDEALAELQQATLEALAEPILIQGMKGERALNTEMLRRIRDGEIAFEAIGGGKTASNEPFDPPGPWEKLWYDHQSAVGLKWLNGLVEIASAPVVDRPPLWEAWNADYRSLCDSEWQRRLANFPAYMTPALKPTDESDARRQSLLGASAGLLAAERQRRKTGDWPASIAEIDPAILKNPPLDPHTGKPFLITRNGGKFIVHSVGPNLKDEQGAYDYKAAAKLGTSDDIGMRAWDVPLRKQPPMPEDKSKPAS